MAIMDLVLSPDNIEKTRKDAERYVTAVYPKPDLDKTAVRSLIRGLGSAAIGAIPYALGAKGLGRGIALSGAYDAGKLYAEAKAKEQVHKELLTNILTKMLEMQSEAYLSQEQNEQRRAAWQNFLQMFSIITNKSKELSPADMTAAMIGAAVQSGLDPAQLNLFSKVMGLSNQIAKKKNLALKFLNLPPGSMVVGLDEQGNIRQKIVNPRQPNLPKPPDEYKKVRAQKEAYQYALLRIAMKPEYSKYVFIVGDNVNLRPDTPEEIKNQFYTDVLQEQARILGAGTPSSFPNPPSFPHKGKVTHPNPAPTSDNESILDKIANFIEYFRGEDTETPMNPEDPLADALGLTPTEKMLYGE